MRGLARRFSRKKQGLGVVGRQIAGRERPLFAAALSDWRRFGYDYERIERRILMSDEDRAGPYLPPGTAVRLNRAEEEEDEQECGVVVHCWLDEIGFYDCHIAFYGSELPTGKPKERPYILRYASVVLTVLDSSKAD